MTEKNRHINLFKDKPKKKKTVNNKVFDMMVAESDKTKVDLFSDKADKNIKKIDTDDAHTALMIAGMTPGIGNAADLIDASLYLMEGEFGKAALSTAAAIPIFGVFFSGAKTGKKSYRLYRGIRGKELSLTKVSGVKGLKSGKRIMGSGKWEAADKIPGRLYTSLDPATAFEFADNGGGLLIKFDVPIKYIKKHGKVDTGFPDEMSIIFKYGLPKKFMKGYAKASDVLKTDIFVNSLGMGIHQYSPAKFLPKTFWKDRKSLIKDIKESKYLYRKILENKSFMKTTKKEVKESMSAELGVLENLLETHKKTFIK